MAVEATEPSHSSPPAGAAAGPHLVNLPSETLRAILSYVERADLTSLCLVSKAVRAVAVTHLYRSLSYEFNGAKPGEQLVDRLAGILETLVISDFDYTSHIKEINVGCAAYLDNIIAQEFNYGNSCGKFFNTLLLAVLKKVSSLETFHWDICVELSPSVFEALEKIPSLRHLHVRLQAGASFVSSPATSGADAVPTSSPATAPHHHNPPPIPPSAGFSFGNPLPPGAAGTNLVRLHEVHKFPKSPRTFSRVPQLESFAVLGMYTLEYVPEIAECISLCSGTLKTLKLSFSGFLAMKARSKPTTTTTDTESTLSDEDNDWDDPDNFVPPAAPAASANAPNDPDTRREQMEQEKVLGTIFGLVGKPKTDESSDSFEQFVADALASAQKKSRNSAKSSGRNSSDRMFMKELGSISRELGPKRGSRGITASKAWKAIERLQKAADAYLERCENEEQVVGEEKVEDASSPHPVSGDPPIFPIDVAGPSTSAPQNDQGQETSPEAEKSGSILPSDNHDDCDDLHEDQKRRILDVVDMEHPDDDGEDGEDQEFLDPDEEPSRSEPRDLATLNGFPGDGEPDKGKEPIRGTPNGSVEPASITNTTTKTNHTNDRDIHEYIRSHHGLPLENLSIYLIPVKPSVICRAINVWALKHISLLNVGSQRAFWATLGKLNESAPLQITSIHTDNVTSAFLDFVHGLGHVDELFMFERSSRHPIKPLAPKTTVPIDEIRRKVLKKHTKHLKRLIIRNDDDTSWTLNKKTAIQISGSSPKLKELVVPMNSVAFHIFLQDLPQLKSLEVLHVLFSATDNSPYLLREIRSCMLDHVVLRDCPRIRYVAASHAIKEPINTAISRIDKKIVRHQPSGRSRRNSDSSMSDTSSVFDYAVKSNEPDSKDQGGKQPQNSKDNEVKERERALDITEGLKLEDINDVRVWEVDIWSMWI